MGVITPWSVVLIPAVGLLPRTARRTVPPRFSTAPRRVFGGALCPPSPARGSPCDSPGPAPRPALARPAALPNQFYRLCKP